MFTEYLGCGGMKPVIENTGKSESCQAILHHHHLQVLKLLLISLPSNSVKEDVK